MSIIERKASAIRGAGKQTIPNGTPTGPDVEAKLNEALGKLQALELQHGEVAFEQVLGVEGGQARLDALVAQIASARVTVENLQKAHSVALQRDAAAERAQRAALYKTQLAAVRTNLTASDAAAEAFAAAAGEAIKQFRIMVERREKAFAANPLGGAWPDDGIAHLSDLKPLCSQELFRLDARDATYGTARSFPRAAVHNPDWLAQPEKILSLVDALKANTSYVIATLTGRKVA